MHHIINRAQNNRAPINDTTIIHTLRINRHARREESKNHSHKRIYRRDNINRQSPPAEIPGSQFQFAAPDFLHDDDYDGDEVAGEVGADGEGDDGVEGYVAADLD